MSEEEIESTKLKNELMEQFEEEQKLNKLIIKNLKSIQN